MNFRDFCRTVIMLTLCGSLFACKSRVDLNTGTFTGRQLRFGTEVPLLKSKLDVVLVKDGRVFYSGLHGEYREVYRMKRMHAWLLMRAVRKVGSQRMEYNEPGNQINYFLNYWSRSRQFGWKWGKEGPNPPTQLQHPVNELKDFLKK